METVTEPKEAPKEIVPDLVSPETRADRKNDIVDKPTAVRYVDYIDFIALAVNAATLALIGIVAGMLVIRKIHEPILLLGIPLSIMWFVGVMFVPRMWTQVPGRMARIFTDNLTKKLAVYTQGFNFVPWYYSKSEIAEIDFQKHEAMICSKKDSTAITFNSLDGYGMVVELDALFGYREGEDALSHSLNYKPEDLRKWTLAVIVGRLSDLGARNSYKTLLYNKKKVADWVAKIFGGEDIISDYEKNTGISVKNPILRDLDLSPESKQTFGVRSKIGMIAEGIKQLVAANVDPVEAAKIVQVAEGSADRSIITYEGLPQGATIVALGEKGVAAVTGGKQGKGKKGEQ